MQEMELAAKNGQTTAVCTLVIEGVAEKGK